MLKTTEDILRAAIAADPSIPVERINIALAALRGAQTPNSAQSGDEVLTLAQVADCLKRSRRMVLHYADAGLIKPVFGIGRSRIGYSRNSVQAFIADGSTVRATA